ncbi:MAG: site-specific integrase [Planctomycetota bacterium]
MKAFGRIVCPEWCHQIGTEQREKFVAIRITELPSPESVDTALRALRLIFNKAIEWKHVAGGANPFSGKGGATVGTRRKKKMQLSKQAKPKHFSRQEIVAILNQADQEVRDSPDGWARQRIRALIYFVAYTGVRAGEALYLEWDEVNLESGLADISFKIEHGLKTESSENFIGLPDAMIPILSEWNGKRTCRWVFPNSAGNPWISGAPGTKALDELKELAKRAGVTYATLKMFRHSLNTHGKQWFGLSREQMRMQLRHTTQETQKHYDHVDKANLHAAVRALDYRKSEN